MSPRQKEIAVTGGVAVVVAAVVVLALRPERRAPAEAPAPPARPAEPRPARAEPPPTPTGPGVTGVEELGGLTVARGEVLLQFKPGVTREQIEQFHQQHRSHDLVVTADGFRRIRLGEGVALAAALAELQRDPLVASVSANTGVPASARLKR